MILKTITKVILHNFQSHSDLQLEMGDFTAITGPSGRGKSAIVRAIKWCLYNISPGNKTKFIKRGTTKSWVTIEFSDGTIITRTRNKSGSENTYDITYSNGESIHLEKFGTGMVQEALDAHKMYPIELFGNSDIISISEQHDAAFFLGETPTNRAVMIGNLGNTDVIDLAIKNTATEIRGKKAKLKEYKTDLKEVKQQLSALKGLDSLEKALEFAQKKYEAIAYIDVKIKNIEQASKQLLSYETKKEELKESIIDENLITEVQDLLDEALSLVNTITSIKKIDKQLKSAIEEKNRLSDFLDKINQDDIDNVIEEIDSAIEISKRISSIKKYSNNLSSLEKQYEELRKLPDCEEVEEAMKFIKEAIEVAGNISSIKSVNKKIDEQLSRKNKGESVIKQIDTDYKNAVEEYKNSLIEEKMCPVCMSNLTEDNLQDIDKYI